MWLYPQKSFVLCNSFVHPDVSKGDTCKAAYAKVMINFKEQQQTAAAQPEAPRADVNPTEQGAPKVGNDKAPQAQPGPALWRCCLQNGLDIRAGAKSTMESFRSGGGEGLLQGQWILLAVVPEPWLGV